MYIQKQRYGGDLNENSNLKEGNVVMRGYKIRFSCMTFILKFYLTLNVMWYEIVRGLKAYMNLT